MELKKSENEGILTLGKSRCKVDGILDDDGCFYFELSNKVEILSFYEELDINLDQIPNNIKIGVMWSHDVEDYKFTTLFSLFGVEKKDNQIQIITTSYGRDLHHIDYKDYVYYRAMVAEVQHLDLTPTIEYTEEDGMEDVSSLALTFQFENSSNSIRNILEKKIKPVLTHLQKVVDLQINDFKWNKEYEKNEKLFSLELLHPLFFKMGFEKVIYNHGNKEFGKDFILSKINEFGIEDYYGVQVKAGDISGRVNSQIDELIGQCNDAFSVPWKDIKRNNSFISKIIIAVSGTFSENAKVKIKHKLSNVINSNIIFLDKDLIVSLNRKYLNK